ncbi:MAG TPA: NADPH-dependent FMN reductase [Xanthobacteraceae bacterium]|jgi:chromate reductase|nr:NADPH-dependent FMN reductase [Xanthobacteraceae bacterium]
MSDRLNVIVICGSLRKGSYNAALARTLPRLAPPGMSITPAPSFASFPIYNFDIQNSSGFPAPVMSLVDAIRAADGVIIVSPEYNWSIPGGLKNAIDWISRLKDQPFQNKPVALQSAAGGPLGGARMQYHLRQSLTSVDAVLFGKPEIFVTFAAQKFDEKTLELKDQPTIDIVKQQLAAFETFIRKWNGSVAKAAS